MWILWSLLILFYHLVNSASSMPECGNNTVCNQGYICKDNICKECIKCTLLFRKGSSCESDFNDCGPCLPGYKEISVTNFSNIVKPCRPENLNSCTYDEDCPVNSYCYKKFCTVCFDCSILNKLPPSNGCAKDFSKCGFCIDGFYALPVTTYSDIQVCEKKVPESDNFPKLVLSVSNILPSCILIMFTAMIIKLIIGKYKANNHSKDGSFEQQISPSAPPLVSGIPKRVLLKEENCSTVTFDTESKQQGNMAKVFKQPHALYYFSEESEDDTNDHSNDSSGEGSNFQQRSSEPEEVRCPPSVFIHSYSEMSNHTSSFEEVSESMRAEGQANVPTDNADSESPSENASKTSQNENSKSPKF